MRARVLDFETTDEPKDDVPAGVIEAGWCDVVDGVPEAAPVSLLVNPGLPIAIKARAVHHLSPEDLDGAPPPDIAFRRLMEGSPDYFVAHNADFERHFFRGGEIPWICTYKVALRLWPDAPGHGNQALRYFLDLDCDRALASPPHRAGPDAYVTARLFAKILDEGVDPDVMVRWSSGPALLPTIGFGKHKGSKWEDAPSDYLRWIVEKSDLDRDAKANAKHHLKLRGEWQ